MFLQHLDTAFRVYKNEPDWGERGYPWFLDVFRRRFENFREKCPQAADALQRAVQDSRLNVDVAQHNPFFGTMLDNEFVFQSYYAETTYFLTRLVFDIVPSAPSPATPQAGGPAVP